MQNADFTPDLRALEQDYQVLTELDQTAETRTYLARHLELNRDVTITIVHATSDVERRVLERFAVDVERLRTLRHPNIIPVIEGRRLATDQFAVVRARVRGSSLDQLVSAVGPIPQQRVASMLDQVRSALEWARQHGIADRHVSEDAMIVQQGSGRVLLSFDPAPGTDGHPADACDDARTIGSLSWQMLSGQRLDGGALRSLAALRPDLSSTIVTETNALVHCWPGGPVGDTASYIALLAAPDATVPVSPTAAAATAARSTPAVPTPAVPVAPRPAPAIPTPAVAAAAVPVGAAAPTNGLPTIVEPVGARQRGARGSTGRTPSRWSFGARLVSLVVVLGVLGLLGFLYLQRGPSVDRTALGGETGNGQAAGDVGVRTRPDSAVDGRSLPPLSSRPTGMGPAPVAPAPMDSMPAALPPAQMPESLPSTERARMSPPETRRHEPPRAAPPATFPSDPASSPASPPAASPSSGDICDSPAQGDQHRCLMRAIDDNDVTLNAVYNRLVTALGASSRVSPDGSDGRAVERLRAAQRSWLDTRDQNCHNVGSGPLYARERSRCFADESARRTRELSRMLDSVKSAPPDSVADRGRADRVTMR